MSIRKDIFDLLSPLVGGRCSPVPSVQKMVAPYIVYQVITEDPADQLHGGTSDMDFVRAQITCFALTQNGAANLSKLARDTFTSLASIPNLAAVIEGGSDDFDNELQLYSSDFDALIYT